MGVDGWWPDEGDPLDIPSRLVRNRMYWEGPQIDRPNERPYALHRNGYRGHAALRIVPVVGDVYSTWETLKMHIPIGGEHRADGNSLLGHRHRRIRADEGIHRGTLSAVVSVWRVLSAVSLPRPDVEAAAAVGMEHWRSWASGRCDNYNGAAVPDPSELHNAQVEPICRKYLELRYRMLPYLYSVVRECTMTGHADHARVVAALSRRREGGGVRRSVFVGKGCAGRAGGGERRNNRGASIFRAEAGTISGLVSDIEGGREISARGRSGDDCPFTFARDRFCRWVR